MGQAISCRSMICSAIKKMRVQSPKKLPEPVDEEEKQLNPFGMRSLLEQAFKVKNSSGESVRCFSIIMFNSKRFCNVARYYPVYQFGIQINSQSTRFTFMSQPKAKDRLMPVDLDLEKACKLVQMLNPALTAIDIKLSEDEEFPCFELLSLVKGKIHLKFLPRSNVQIMSQLIETHWDQLVELYCVAAALSPNLPVKSFKLLDVQEIENANQMRKILRHNVKYLLLDFGRHGRIGSENVDMLLPDVGRIGACILFMSGLDLLSGVRFFLNNCPKLEYFKVVYYRMKMMSPIYTTRFIVEDVLFRSHDTYNQVFNLLTQSSVDSSLTSVEGCFYGDGFMLSTDWTDALLTRNEFRKVQQETTVDEEGFVSTTFSDVKKSSNVFGKFFIDVQYRYGINAADMEDMGDMDGIQDLMALLQGE